VNVKLGGGTIKARGSEKPGQRGPQTIGGEVKSSKGKGKKQQREEGKREYQKAHFCWVEKKGLKRGDESMTGAKRLKDRPTFPAVVPTFSLGQAPSAGGPARDWKDLEPLVVCSKKGNRLPLWGGGGLGTTLV